MEGSGERRFFARRSCTAGMEHTPLGDTGMEVSRICLGCMSFGDGWS